MQRIALVLLGLSLAMAQLAHADEWSKTYTITGKPNLRVETSDANIHVETWEQNTIDVRVSTEHYKIGADGIKIVAQQNGDVIELEVRFPHDVHFGFNIHSNRVDVDIHMPKEGRINLHTGDGAIRLANFKGEMELQSGDGPQDVDGVDGSLRAHAGDGHIHATGRFDALEMTTGDGQIEARALPGSTMASGWDLHAGDGSVTLRLPDNFAADLDLRTGDGHITTDVPLAVAGSLGKKDIRGKLNGGGNLLTIHTGDGSIRLEKS
jgi:hypothetical protein